MRSDLAHAPAAAVLRITFDRPGESIVAAAHALMSREPAIEARTTVDERAGRLATTTFTATAPSQALWLAPPLDGSILAVPLAEGAELFVALDAWLASSPGVSLDTTWSGAARFFEGRRLLARAWGAGEIWLGAAGGVLPLDLGADPPSFTADTDHVLAFTQGLRHAVHDQEGLRSPAGAGRAAVLSGQGRLWLQTRRPSALSALCHPFRGVGGGRAE